MLPFLQKNKHGVQSGIAVKTREPDEKPDIDEDDKDAAIHACAQDLITAIHAHNIKDVADALRSAFEILDSMPHAEGEHIEPHSYLASKED